MSTRNLAQQVAIVTGASSGIGRAITIAADVAREDRVEAMFAETLDRLGRLDLLVNNAGIERPSPIRDMTLADWQAVIDVNLTGQFLCSRAAIRAFPKHTAVESPAAAIGSIVFIGSVHQVIPWAFQVNYAALKGGVALLMQSLAQEVAPMRSESIRWRPARSVRLSTGRPGRATRRWPSS